MKNVLAQTANVKKALETVEYLKSRPKREMVGLGLIYGEPGNGKTRFAMQTAFGEGYIYHRLDAATSQRSFLVNLLEELHRKYFISRPVKGTAQKLYEDVVEILNNAADCVIFIDEIDYAFKDKKLLGTIRDIVDETITTIVLFGMTDAENRLRAANTHYFDRCNSFYKFKSLTLKDAHLICDAICDVKLSDDAIQYAYDQSKGTIRKIVKVLDFFERKARTKGLTELSLKDMK